MSKYIDVEPIIEWAKDPTANLPYGASGVDWEQKIFNAPTIDIVRCKDCQWFDSGKNDIAEWHFCKRHFGIYPNFDADDFCSYGERSEP